MSDATYPQAILDLLDAGGDRPVFEHGTSVVGASGMAALVRRIAAGLRAAGVGPGDGVAMLVGVHAEAFAATVAAFALGARVSGVRPELTAEQRAHVLGQGVTVAVVDGGRAGTGVPPGGRAGTGVPPGGWAGTGVPPGIRVLELSRLVAAPDDGRPLAASGRPGDVARIVYTSGSTGRPRGCAQTYAALAAGWTARPDRWPPAIRRLASGLGRYLVFGSLSSQVMMEYGVLALAAGGTMVVADPPSFPAAIARYRATASVITVPRLYAMVREQRRRPVDLSSLRALMVSGSPLPPGRLREAVDVLGPVVFHGYGQTETGMITMLTPHEMAAGPERLATVGRPPAVTDLEIRDAQGCRLPPGVDGELWVRTPAQAAGYWCDPVETAEVFVDGWVRTRDLARLGRDGYLRLLGRLRDVIIVNANVVPAGPIERVLAGHPAVAEAYVVGVPDEHTGEAVHAFVVPVDQSRPLPAESRRALLALVRGRLGDVAVPRTVTAIDGVPVGASGKPDKSALIAAVPVDDASTR